MNFPRQFFGITRRIPTTEKLARSNHENVVTAIGYEKGEEEEDNFFDYIIGYYDVKRFLKMSINTDEPVHILLVGPPASAKTMIIKSMMKLNSSYFTDGGNSTKAEMLDIFLTINPNIF